jgi:SAM-dependent methyltransferase
VSRSQAPVWFFADVAKVVDADNLECSVQFLSDGLTAAARWSDSILGRGIVVRPCHFVVVAVREAEPTSFEVVWRGAAVATVTSADGTRLTYDTGYPPHRGVTRTVHDLRPDAERRATQPGQQIVVFHLPDDPDSVYLVDVAVDGLPLHTDRLRADWLARAERTLLADTVDARQLVADGYDRMAERYATWAADELSDDVRPRYAAYMVEHLPACAAVLELGCGGGGPVTRRLSARFKLTGVDISTHQIELARARVPTAEFVHADMSRCAFPADSFDCVAAFYSFLHLPHGELPDLLRKIGTWLRTGGLLVATMATRADAGTVEPDWLGIPMYFSGYAPADSRRFVIDAGLEIETFRYERILEQGRPTRFLWVVARKLHGS